MCLHQWEYQRYHYSCGKVTEDGISRKCRLVAAQPSCYDGCGNACAFKKARTLFIHTPPFILIFSRATRQTHRSSSYCQVPRLSSAPPPLLGQCRRHRYSLSGGRGVVSRGWALSTDACRASMLVRFVQVWRDAPRRDGQAFSSFISSLFLFHVQS